MGCGPRVDHSLQEAGLGGGGGLPDITAKLVPHNRGKCDSLSPRGSKGIKFTTDEIGPLLILGYTVV